MKWWEVLLEVVKYSVPALIVYFTVFNLTKEFYKKEYNLKLLQSRDDSRETTLPLKLQAYERLALFCERAKIQNMVLRLQGNSVNAATLQATLLITLQQEFDHNVAQQIYVSEELWKIITLAKNNTVSIITKVYETLPPNAANELYINALFGMLNEANQDPLDTALSAIKKELSAVL